ncbi:hypothetical protein CW304_04525 [Bacillus sp. UFRGS-B20]|nr:hypothetical protein CW304_04525 [Bacillus sp. UFRGS-B20]
MESIILLQIIKNNNVLSLNFFSSPHLAFFTCSDYQMYFILRNTIELTRFKIQTYLLFSPRPVPSPISKMLGFLICVDVFPCAQLRATPCVLSYRSPREMMG